MSTPKQAGCGCAVRESSGRRAIAVDPDVKAKSLNRLRRIEGQVRGLQRMVEGERYCADILTQVATHGAYHRGQIAKAIRRGGGTPADTDFIIFVREQG